MWVLYHLQIEERILGTLGRWLGVGCAKSDVHFTDLRSWLPGLRFRSNCRGGLLSKELDSSVIGFAKGLSVLLFESSLV